MSPAGKYLGLGCCLGFLDALLDALGATLAATVEFFLTFNFLMSHWVFSSGCISKGKIHTPTKNGCPVSLQPERCLIPCRGTPCGCRMFRLAADHVSWLWCRLYHHTRRQWYCLSCFYPQHRFSGCLGYRTSRLPVLQNISLRGKIPLR